MQVFQSVYTKVAPDESPHKEADFHTLFYPTSLLTKQDVREIERKIHFPGGKFISKKTVFYHRLQGKDYLIILHLQNLPEARDTFGRGGIFICQGFIFPKELWRLCPEPMRLFEVVRDKLFRSREEVLNSPLVDKNTGNIQPIELSEDTLNNLPNNLPEFTSELEQKLLISLLRIADTEDNPKLLLKGTPDAICNLMDKLFAYIPDEIKPKLGWDSALDGGSLTFYPLNIVGYRERPPIGAVSLKIDIETQEIEESEVAYNFFSPHTPIEKWLYHCKRYIETKADIESAYNLSLLIDGKITPPITEELPSFKRIGFAEVNKEEIKEAFIKACRRHLPEQIIEHITLMLSPYEMLSLIIEDIPLKRLADYTEQVLIKNNLKLTEPLPQILLSAASKRLKLISKLYTERKLTIDDLKSLNQEDKIAIINYILLIEWKNMDWILDILKEDIECFTQLLSSYATKNKLEELIKTCIIKDKEYSQIAQLLIKEAIKQNKVFSLLRKEISPQEIIENLLKEVELPKVDMKNLILWAKRRRPPEIKFPYIRTFLYPRQGIPEEFLEDIIKKRLLVWLKAHGFKPKELKGLGFEIEPEKKGLLERAKKMLGFGGDKR